MTLLCFGSVQFKT